MNALLVSHPHYPTRFAPPHLPPLSKGGGLTAKHKLLPCNVLLAIHPSFLFTKPFRHQDGGIVTPTIRSAPTFQKPHYPLPRTITLASPRKRGGGLTALQNRYFHHLHFVIYRTVSKIAILLPSRRWGLLPIRTINEIFRSIPRSTLPHLPPLSKGGGLTARQKLLFYCVIFAIYPPFFIHQTFPPSRRRDCHAARTKPTRPLPKVNFCHPQKIPANTLSLSPTPPLTIPQ